MKKITFVFLAFCSLSLEAQGAGKPAFFLGLETNNNTRDGISFGAAPNIEFGLIGDFAAGIKSTFSYNFKHDDKFFVIEPAAFARWYFLNPAMLYIFLQADAGASFISEETLTMKRSAGTFMAAGGAGARIFFKNFFGEVYARFGTPFLWGAGINIGYRLNKALWGKKTAGNTGQQNSTIPAEGEEK